MAAVQLRLSKGERRRHPPPPQHSIAAGGALGLLWRRKGRTAVGVIGAICLKKKKRPKSRAQAVSVTVLDRNHRLLRAFTAADGRWRLRLDGRRSTRLPFNADCF